MSTDLNSVVLIGRLTRDAELTYLQSGSAVAKFSIAVNRAVKNGEQWVDEASYFDISLYGKQAESLKQFLLKGKQIGVQGSLKQDRWEKDGQKFSKVSVIANSVELLGGQSQTNGFTQPQGNFQSQQGSYQQGNPYAGQTMQGYGQPQGQPGYGQRPPAYQSPQENFPPQEFPEGIPF